MSVTRSTLLAGLAWACLQGCTVAPPPLSPPQLVVTGNAEGVVVFAHCESTCRAAVLSVSGLESFQLDQEVPEPRTWTFEQGEVRMSLPDALPPGRYEAVLTAEVVSADGRPSKSRSNTVTFEIPRRFDIIAARDVIGDDRHLIDLRVRMLMHRFMQPNELVSSVARAAVDVAFTQVQPLAATASRPNPWEELEENRQRIIRATSEDDVLPEMDPQALLVVDHRPPSEGLPEQIVLRLYDLSCRQYDSVESPVPFPLTMHRALIFEEYAEVASRPGGSTAVDHVDAWRRLLGALQKSARFQEFLGALNGPEGRLELDGPNRHLLGYVSSDFGADEPHARIEQQVLFPTPGEMQRVELSEAAREDS